MGRVVLRAPVSWAVGVIALLACVAVAFTVSLSAPDVSPSDPGGGSWAVEPGAPLPDDRWCADQVTRSPWEPRPENRAANNAVPDGPVPSLSWSNAASDSLKNRVTGDFTGTTDEIIQWASCKWGFDPDVTRAQAVRETGWIQSAVGDGGVSYGIMQIRSNVWTGTHPWSEWSTAYNLDWSLGLRRACYEGYLYSGLGRGDLWGCLGVHFSGEWRAGGADEYAQNVREALTGRFWEQWPSAAGGSPPASDR